MQVDWIHRRRHGVVGGLGLLILTNMMDLQYFLKGITINDAASVRKQQTLKYVDSNLSSFQSRQPDNAHLTREANFQNNTSLWSSSNAISSETVLNSQNTMKPSSETNISQSQRAIPDDKVPSASEDVEPRRTGHDASVLTTTDLDLHDYANKSSLDYYGCCGAGHRLIRTANAYHLARAIKFGLRVFWGKCDKTEVYNYLFGPEPLEDLHAVTSTNQRIAAFNEVDGFNGPVGRDGTCRCSDDKIQNDVKFYSSLRDRFRERQQVDDFVQQHFDGSSLTIGLHIRAGNNETGDFRNKKRGIENVTEWFDNVVGHIGHLLQQRQRTSEAVTNASFHPPVLFVATDTPSVFYQLQSVFPKEMLRVVQFPHQILATEGQGVSFGQAGASTPQGNECLMSWDATFIDMILLSQVDILVAPRYSSFSQSIPLSLLWAKPNKSVETKERHVTSSPAFCEMDRPALNMYCYDSYKTWCCNRTMSGHPVEVMFPDESLFSNRSWIKITPRSTQCDVEINHRKCLPFHWDDYSL